MIVITIYILVAIFAPWIAPYGEAEVFAQPYAPWGGEHLLGTDQIGRDIYSRMIYGARNTVGIALVTHHPGLCHWWRPWFGGGDQSLLAGSTA
jgi:peptide/nickel transport system permease protein